MTSTNSELLASASHAGGELMLGFALECKSPTAADIAVTLRSISETLRVLPTYQVSPEIQMLCYKALEDLFKICTWPSYPGHSYPGQASKNSDAQNLYDILLHLFESDKHQAITSIKTFFTRKPEHIRPYRERFENLLNKLNQADQSGVDQYPRPQDEDNYPEHINRSLVNIIRKVFACDSRSHEVQPLKVTQNSWHHTRICLNYGVRAGGQFARVELITATDGMKFWNEISLDLSLQVSNEYGDSDSNLDPENQDSDDEQENIYQILHNPHYRKISLSLDRNFRLDQFENLGVIHHIICPGEGFQLSSILRLYNLSVKHKVMLAYAVARSFWQLYSSDLMNARWSSDDIWFMPVDSQSDNNIPLKAFVSFPLGQYNPSPAEYLDAPGVIHRYPRILFLGTVLLEIGFGEPLGLEYSPNNPTRSLAAHINKTYSRARMLLKRLKELEWHGFQHQHSFIEAVANCLDSQNFNETEKVSRKHQRQSQTDYQDLKNTGTQDLSERKASLYGKVVAPLSFLTNVGFNTSADMQFLKMRPTSTISGGEDARKFLGMIARGALDERDEDGRTPLSWVASDNERILRRLLEQHKDINPDQPDNNGRTPLSWAAGTGNYESVRVLSQHPDVDPNQRDHNERTPLSWAAENGHVVVVDNILRGFTQEHQPKLDLVSALEKRDRQGETVITRAAQNCHEAVLRILLRETLAEGSGNESVLPSVQSRAVAYMHEAAKRGWPSLIKILVERKFDIKYLNDLLCFAAEYGHPQVVDLLLTHRANPDYQIKPTQDTPLILAIRGKDGNSGQEGVVKLLLDANADINKYNAKEETALDLAKEHNLFTILSLLIQKHKDGALAKTVEELKPLVDAEFQATVVEFVLKSGLLQHSPEEKSVKDLLLNPSIIRTDQRADPSFRWLHLPANNMRWVEVLMAQLYQNSAQAYRVLSPERWVDQQHLGPSGVHHARFMRPLCQAFATESDESRADMGLNANRRPLKETNLALFMPYFHWDMGGQYKNRRDILGQKTEAETIPSFWKRDQKLHNAYLFDNHPLHTRRSLNQYYYYTLKDTKKRDSDQVVSRQQKGYAEDSKVMTVVDQLWLWVLVGSCDQPDTVITCFPERDVQEKDDPDKYRSTDILRHIKVHLRTKIHSVKTVYDLAGLIAGKCSRAYFDIGLIDERLRFLEMYETEIGDAMREEAELFEAFAKFSWTRPKAPKNSPGSNTVSTVAMNEDEVLEITQEISELRKIKDAQDELNIMSMLFEDQRRVLCSMDNFLQSMVNFTTNSQVILAPIEGSETPDANTEDTALNKLASAEREDWEDHHRGTPLDADEQDTSNRVRDLNIDNMAAIYTDHSVGPRRTIPHINDSARGEAETAHKGDSDFGVSPLALVHLSIDDVNGMVQRAKKAYIALNFLVDLKQKQSNVMDARLARIQAEEALKTSKATERQAEESLKMSKESKKQGKTIMVFTIVTIVFLPMSFLSSFFTINITQFRRDPGGTMSLGYVSEIMFPISAAITAFLVYVAFRVEDVETWLDWIKIKRRREKKAAGDIEPGKGRL